MLGNNEAKSASRNLLCGSFGQPCFVDSFAQGARLNSKRVPIRTFPRVLSCFSSFWPAANSHFIVFYCVFDIPPASPSQFLLKFARFRERVYNNPVLAVGVSSSHILQVFTQSTRKIRATSSTEAARGRHR